MIRRPTPVVPRDVRAAVRRVAWVLPLLALTEAAVAVYQRASRDAAPPAASVRDR